MRHKAAKKKQKAKTHYKPLSVCRTSAALFSLHSFTDPHPDSSSQKKILTTTFSLLILSQTKKEQHTLQTWIARSVSSSRVGIRVYFRFSGRFTMTKSLISGSASGPDSNSCSCSESDESEGGRSRQRFCVP